MNELSEHCIHENVCKNYTNDCGWGFDDSGAWGWQGGFECIIMDCEYDTRHKLRKGGEANDLLH